MHKIIIIGLLILFTFNGCSRNELRRAELLVDTVEFVGNIVGKIAKSNSSSNSNTENSRYYYYPKSEQDCYDRKMKPIKAANGSLICKGSPANVQRNNSHKKDIFYYPKNEQDCYNKNLKPIIAANGSLICQGKLLNQDDTKLNKKNNDNTNSISFTGIFSSDINNVKCATTGKVTITIINEKLNGHILYDFKNKQYKRKLWGNIENKEFFGQTKKIKFYGDYNKNKTVLNGEYFNRVCKGTFKLYKHLDR